MAKSNGKNNNEPLAPDWGKFSGLEEVADGRTVAAVRVLERAGPSVALALVAPHFNEPLIQAMTIALAGAIGIIQAVAEVVRRIREAPHDTGTDRRREVGA